MVSLTLQQARRVARTLDAIAAAGGSPAGFARAGVTMLGGLVGSDLTTLSDCDVAAGHRRVASDDPHALTPRDVERFDAFFHTHPLVRAHAFRPQVGTRRISDQVSPQAFRRTALYGEYYRPLGLGYVVAVPICTAGPRLVSFVFNRSARDFDDGECALLEALRAPLAALFARAEAQAAAQSAVATFLRGIGVERAAAGIGSLTPREREVLAWVAAGKDNGQIAGIVGASPRTVQKHLEHVYAKLGVESRTAAAMRLIAAGGVGA